MKQGLQTMAVLIGMLAIFAASVAWQIVGANKSAAPPKVLETPKSAVNNDEDQKYLINQRKVDDISPSYMRDIRNIIQENKIKRCDSIHAISTDFNNDEFLVFCAAGAIDENAWSYPNNTWTPYTVSRRMRTTITGNNTMNCAIVKSNAFKC